MGQVNRTAGNQSQGDIEGKELDYRIRVNQGIREPVQQRRLVSSLTESVITSKQPLLVRDFEQEKPHLPPLRDWSTQQPPVSWLGVPMLNGDSVVGVISLKAYQPNAFDDEELELLSTIADTVAVAIENAQLFDSAQRRSCEVRLSRTNTPVQALTLQNY